MTQTCIEHLWQRPFSGRALYVCTVLVSRCVFSGLEKNRLDNGERWCCGLIRACSAAAATAQQDGLTSGRSYCNHMGEISTMSGAWWVRTEASCCSPSPSDPTCTDHWLYQPSARTFQLTRNKKIHNKRREEGNLQEKRGGEEIKIQTGFPYRVLLFFLSVHVSLEALWKQTDRGISLCREEQRAAEHHLWFQCWWSNGWWL